MTPSDENVARPTAHYQPADLSPAEFEIFVASLFESLCAGAGITDLHIQTHEVIEGADGTYDFDATVRYRLAGMSFLVVVEAKKHKNPIKREQVQVLLQKLHSVGAHKAVLFSTAPFQRGALDFALAHGVALVTVTEGRFTYETRGAAPTAPLTRAEATSRGIPAFVGHGYRRSDEGGVLVTLMSPEYPEYVAEHVILRA